MDRRHYRQKRAAKGSQVVRKRGLLLVPAELITDKVALQSGPELPKEAHPDLCSDL